MSACSGGVWWKGGILLPLLSKTSTTMKDKKARVLRDHCGEKKPILLTKLTAAELTWKGNKYIKRLRGADLMIIYDDRGSAGWGREVSVSWQGMDLALSGDLVMMGKSQAFSEFSEWCWEELWDRELKIPITRKCKRQRAVKTSNYCSRERAADMSSKETLTEQSGARCVKQNPSRCLDR